MKYRQRIKDLRQDADLNQTQVAQILFTSQKVYSRYETGVSKMPIHHLITLCEYYNVSADYLLGFTDTPTPLPKK